jgi:hypothetical protein
MIGTTTMDNTPHSLRYFYLAATQHLTSGLTFDLDKCAPVLDHALCGLNKQIGIPDQLVAWIGAGSFAAGPWPYDGRGRIIIEVQLMMNTEGQHGCFATVQKSDEREIAPVICCPTPTCFELCDRRVSEARFDCQIVL